MQTAKRLIFLLPFTLAFAGLCLQINTILIQSDFLLSLNLNSLLQLVSFSVLLLTTSLFFIIFVSLAGDWKVVIPSVLVLSFSSLLLTNSPASIILASGFFISFSLIFLLLNRESKTYLTFKPAALLTPPTKQLSTLIILVCSIAFFMLASQTISKQGFKIPDSIIDQALQFSTPPGSKSQEENPIDQLQIPAEQLELLKQNPALLKQSGLDPKILDQIGKPASGKKSVNTQDLVKPLVQEQLQNIIKPYISFIPIVLAVLFFFSLQSIIALLSLFVPSIIWLIFLILEKTGFTKYTKEMREVKKLVV